MSCGNYLELIRNITLVEMAHVYPKRKSVKRNHPYGGGKRTEVRESHPDKVR